MLEKEKISPRQVIFLLIVTIISTAIIFLPVRLYSVAEQDSWIALIFGGLLGLFIAYIIAQLAVMYRDKTIIEYSQIILGGVLGKVAGLFICLTFLFLNTVILRQFAELTVIAFYPATPKIFFIVAIVVVSTYTLYQGLENIARVNEIITPVFFILLFSIFLLNISEMNFQQLTPILEHGLARVIKGAFSQAIYSVELVVLTMLLPALNIPTKAQKVSIISVLIIIFFGQILMIGIVAILGNQTSSTTFPFLTLGRYVNIGNFLEQLDSFILVIWVAGVFIKITVIYYCTVLSFSQLLRLKDYQSIILAIGAFQTVFSLIIWNNTAKVTFMLDTYINNTLTIGIFSLLILLFLVAKIKKVYAN